LFPSEKGLGKEKNHFDSNRLLVIIKIGRKLIKVALLSSSKRERESVFVAKISCKQILNKSKKTKITLIYFNQGKGVRGNLKIGTCC
jgi:hypothetical protein